MSKSKMPNKTEDVFCGENSKSMRKGMGSGNVLKKDTPIVNANSKRGNSKRAVFSDAGED